MKLRITKGRIAVVVVLLPVLYVLNIGPLLYASNHFGLSPKVFFAAYTPVMDFMAGTPLGPAYLRYIEWWTKVP